MTIAERDIKAKAPFPARFAPPPAAVTLYPGKVMHARIKPFGHRFTYSVFSMLIDIGRLEEANATSRLFSVNRRNAISFHEADHIEPDIGARSLMKYVRSIMAGAGLRETPARILLLTYPRIFGYVFNPLSIYFAYAADGSLLALVYEVRNTFGGRHTYVCKLEDGELTAAGARQTRTKIFHVSPFIGLGAVYHFRVLPPGNDVRVRILEVEDGTPLLSATFSGEAKAFNTRNLLANLARYPLMTLKIVAGIHWEALKLWLKGAQFLSSPPEPERVSYRDAGGPVETGR